MHRLQIGQQFEGALVLQIGQREVRAEGSQQVLCKQGARPARPELGARSANVGAGAVRMRRGVAGRPYALLETQANAGPTVKPVPWPRGSCSLPAGGANEWPWSAAGGSTHEMLSVEQDTAPAPVAATNSTAAMQAVHLSLIDGERMPLPRCCPGAARKRQARRSPSWRRRWPAGICGRP